MAWPFGRTTYVVKFKDSVCAWALGRAVCGGGPESSDSAATVKVRSGVWVVEMGWFMESVWASVQCQITRDKGRAGRKNIL